MAKPDEKKKGRRGFFARLLNKETQDAPLDEQEALTPPEQPPAENEDVKQQEEEQRLWEETRVPVEGNALYRLYCAARGVTPDEMPGAVFSLSIFMYDGRPPSKEQRAWLQAAEREVRTAPGYFDTEDAEPVHAQPYVWTSADGMSAWAFVLPPMHDGAMVSAAQMAELFKKESVRYGISGEGVAAACNESNCMKLVQVAVGEPPVDGVDGEVIDHFKRTTEIQLVVREDNTIDYKDLGWLQTVYAGDVICDIVPPVDAVNGRSVRDDEVKGKPGKRPAIPRGQGTQINDDGTALVAAMDGIITYQESQGFRVDPLLIIKGDVDGAVGNIQTVGDVLVHGDVREGFVVEATGNVTVQGMAEAAHLLAGGTIRVGRGMNGGVMEASGDILSKFIENANVAASGRIICDSLINSEAAADEAVEVTTGHGAIIGGTVSALRRVRAKAIGNETHRSIHIVLGYTVNYLRENADLTQKLADAKRELEEVDKNLAYLESGQGQPAEEGRTKEEMETARMVLRRQVGTLEHRVMTLRREQQEVDNCFVEADIIYPPAEIEITGISEVIRFSVCDVVVRLQGCALDVRGRAE